MKILTHPLIRYSLTIAFTLLCTVVLVQSSSQPIIGAPAPPGHPDLKREIELTLGHIIGFSLLVILWSWAFVAHLPLKRALFVAVGFALIYGLITEFAQSFVPDRQVSLYDIAVNWTTTAVAAFIVRRYGQT